MDQKTYGGSFLYHMTDRQVGMLLFCSLFLFSLLLSTKSGSDMVVQYHIVPCLIFRFLLALWLP